MGIGQIQELGRLIMCHKTSISPWFLSSSLHTFPKKTSAVEFCLLCSMFCADPEGPKMVNLRPTFYFGTLIACQNHTYIRPHCSHFALVEGPDIVILHQGKASV